MRPILAPLFLAILAAASGCGPAPETSAPTLGAAPSCAAAAAKGAVEMTLGARVGDVFTALHEGDALVVIDGRQGGTWVMPGLRLRGASPTGSVSGGISLANANADADADAKDVGVLPATSVYAEPVAGADGQLEVEYVPIPIGDNPDGSLPDGVAGSPATVSLSYTGACGEAGSLQLEVVLVYEPTG